jgi:3-dehydroquinate synthase
MESMHFEIELGDANIFLKEYLEIKKPSKVAILVDENTYKYCLPKLHYDFDKVIIIKPDEIHKSIDSLQFIWNELLVATLDKDALLINLGGGMVSDIGGFAASTYKRGIPFINIPTTLLAQVDASIGGKTGINISNVKNIVGTFTNPELTIIDTVFLDTLSHDEYRNGKAEMIKHALIADVSQWEFMLKNPFENWLSLVEDSVIIKKKIVAQDFHEHDIRKALNFGHTIGHAIEAVKLTSDMPLKHGEAIVVGMICEAYISTVISKLPYTDFEKIKTFLVDLYSDIFPLYMHKKHFFETILNDKKNTNGGINFTLLEAIGKFNINNISNASLIEMSLQKAGVIFTN